MSEEARRILDAHEAAGGNRNGKMPAMSDEKRTPVTDSEKLADQMAADITSGKVAVKDRPVVRKALDDADGRSKSQDAGEAVWRRARHYTPGLGGAMKPNNWRMGPDGEPREVEIAALKGIPPGDHYETR